MAFLHVIFQNCSCHKNIILKKDMNSSSKRTVFLMLRAQKTVHFSFDVSGQISKHTLYVCIKWKLLSRVKYTLVVQYNFNWK